MLRALPLRCWWRAGCRAARGRESSPPTSAGSSSSSSSSRPWGAQGASCSFFTSPPRAKAKKRPGSWRPQPGVVQEIEEEDADLEDDEYADLEEDEEALWAQHPATALPLGGQNIFLVHPNVKWGATKQHLTTAELQLAEAVTLVKSLPDWTVADQVILSTKTPNSKLIFGKGNFQALTEKIRGSPGITAVFLNVEVLSATSVREMEDAWGVKVFDRYTVALNIFRCNARTQEAKLQIALAEIPLLRSMLKNELADLDQQGGGSSRYTMGSGETYTEVQHRLLKEKEQKIKRALAKIKRNRYLLQTLRRKRELPAISVMGYTNCGKTTLIKALTGDEGLQPRDQLFATLDITAHAGLLPSRMTVLYIDTIGFLSQLPHNLIESFSATLQDVARSDLIIHVRDISHPETVNQKASVLSVLNSLCLPRQLLDSIVEVHNKVDLVGGYQPTEPCVFPISALHGYGLEELKQELETRLLTVTDKQIKTLRINLSGPQLSWLYKEATVEDVSVLPEDGAADVKVIISSSAYGRYKKLFPHW
ncbi:putative GTP-binding protein 6 [Microcaecilia unicolor]|uniref:Putative GTP-binding protein 6 n=1 Tax=Microcaecilia unicolor TaxID=1415580 RepID=A0A6P7XIX5_9AMPH|nr:putative GTP-binding protein 6 [Microcaecilia unicolor]